MHYINFVSVNIPKQDKEERGKDKGKLTTWVIVVQDLNTQRAAYEYMTESVIPWKYATSWTLSVSVKSTTTEYFIPLHSLLY